jgi:hypothetical protein
LVGLTEAYGYVEVVGMAWHGDETWFQDS